MGKVTWIMQTLIFWVPLIISTKNFWVKDYVFISSICLSSCLSVCQRNNLKNNAPIIRKLNTEVETFKSLDEFDNGENASKSSKVIAGYFV